MKFRVSIKKPLIVPILFSMRQIGLLGNLGHWVTQISIFILSLVSRKCKEILMPTFVLEYFADQDKGKKPFF